MLKIKYMSDLHNEFDNGNVFMPNSDDCDVLVLAGDITVGAYETISALGKYAQKFKHVIFVFGNHEFYNHDIWDVREALSAPDVLPSNVHVLDNASVMIDDVLFIGSTLWADMLPEAFHSMNDSRIIWDHTEVGAYSTFVGRVSIETIKAMHKAAKRFIHEAVYQDARKIVVVTHHTPSFASIGDRYKDDTTMNTGYATNILEEFKGFVDLWIHGHTHHCVDYVEHGIRVVSNQRGYVGYELATGFDPDKVITI